jgi:hypothetical protein
MKRNEMSKACGMHRRDEKRINILVGKPRGKRSFGRPKCRWKDSNTLVLRNRDDDDWVYLAYDRVQWQAYVNTAMNPQCP